MEIDGSFQLQDIVDEISRHDELLKLDLSVTVADPLQEDCPLIACSDGFTQLTGYGIAEIVGRNCRFLLNGVPEEHLDEETRLKCRHYVATTKGSPGDPLPDETMTAYLKTQPWMTARPGEIICVQTNATKTGELFKNMFYMKQVELNERPVILGLQAKLPEAWQEATDEAELACFCQQAFARLGRNMCAIEEVLSRHFWYSAAARRQDAPKSVPPSFALQAGVGLAVIRAAVAAKEISAAEKEDDLGSEVGAKWSRRQVSATSTGSGIDDIDEDDGSWARYSTPGSVGSGRHQQAIAPVALHSGFDTAHVQQWPVGCFETLGKIEDANRNQGSVCLMKHTVAGNLVAVKHMPNTWIQESHEAFLESHPHETEYPWNDIGCNSFLNSVGYPYCMQLHGVFRDQERTSIVTEFANGGDLFDWASGLDMQPGPEREARVKPLVKQILHSVQGLHDLAIVHADLSMENILLSLRGDTSCPRVRIIDFGAATTERFVRGRVTGKPSYQAPEMFDDDCTRDGFLSDAFSVGVILYAVFLMDYPWMSTEGKGDKCFQYVKAKGFAEFIKKRKIPNSQTSMSEVLSPGLRSLLGGLLEIDPAKRLTLGEEAFGSGRGSVWDEPWMK